MYQAIYKCRLCGKEIVENKIYDKDDAVEKVKFSCLYTADFYNKYDARNLRMKRAIPHDCQDGSIGLADFQGFKRGD